MTPAKKPRKPRSPIPSWSSTCPSLTSSHRASLASTLTAPSVTSLLLSPHSPYSSHENHPLPTTSAYLEEHPHPHSHSSPRARDSTDMSDFETFARSLKARQGDGTISSDSKLQPAARIKVRKSDGNSVAVCHSPSSPKPPRASERLLRLQNSLADLRMQRRNSPEKPKRASRGGSATPDASGRGVLTDADRDPDTREDTPQPPSPTVADLKRTTRTTLARAQHELDLEDSGDESDLDLSLPLLNAALRSHVIPSSSRLLTTRKKSRADDAVDQLGWSGSDSEEEEFSRTVARIAARKSGVFPNRRLTKRPSLPAGRLHQQSRHDSSASDGRSSPSSSVGPPTPFVLERPSTALGTSRATSTTAELLNALGKKYALPEELPRPKRFIGGWGAPEVLVDDEWPAAVMEADEALELDLEMEMELDTQAVHNALPRPLGAQW